MSSFNLFANNASTTVAVALAAGGTSLTVAIGGGAFFPALSGSSRFYCTLVDSSNNLEIVIVTARAGDVFTITRAQEGTTAKAFPIASVVELRVTAANATNWESGQVLTGPVTSSVVAGAYVTAFTPGMTVPNYILGGTISAAGFGISGAGTISIAGGNALRGSYGTAGGTSNFVAGDNALAGNTTGYNNIAVGPSTLQANTTGNSNSAVGINSLLVNTTGNSNTAIGPSTLSNNVGGSSNTAIGPGASAFNSSGNFNTAIGVNSLLFNNVGSNNTANGSQALYDQTTGNNNTAIGYNTGRGITTGSGNTILGANIPSLSAALTNNILLASGDGVVKGQFDGSGNFSVGAPTAGFTNTNSCALQINQGLLVVNHLNGSASGTYYAGFCYNGGPIGSITQSGTTAVLFNTTSDYRLKDNAKPLTGSGAFIDALKPTSWEWASDGRRDSGFLAHEFQEICPNAVTGVKDEMEEQEYEVSPAVFSTRSADGVELTPEEPAIIGTRTVPKYQAMQAGNSEVIANLVAELQSLRVRIAKLETK